MNEQQKPVRLCGLWKNTSKDGKTYLSGNLGFGKLLIFPNDKKSENGPDYTLMIAEKPQQQGAPRITEDDIPF